MTSPFFGVEIGEGLGYHRLGLTTVIIIIITGSWLGGAIPFPTSPLVSLDILPYLPFSLSIYIFFFFFLIETIENKWTRLQESMDKFTQTGSKVWGGSNMRYT